MEERSYSTILLEVTRDVVRVTLNRPERRNAIGPQMVNELLWVLNDAEADPAIRSIVVSGAGKAFCAGSERQTASC